MSYCEKIGKHKIIFTTKKDHEASPSTIKLKPVEPAPGLILPNGEVNWNCPCLGGMATGPCGVEFRESFSCFHYSEADPKGSDCLNLFQQMQNCFTKYPAVYNKPSKDDDDLDLNINELNENAKKSNTTEQIENSTQKMNSNEVDIAEK